MADTLGPKPTTETAGGRTEEIYWQLRQEIVHGTLRPNEALVEADIAERLNVSRTPVRESMQRLAADGLIASRRRRWFVHEFSPEEVAEIYEARAALEGYAARLAVQRATEDQRARILACREDATLVADGLPTRDRVEVNERFHSLVTAAANNARLANLIERNRSFYFNYQVAALYSTEDLAESSRQHSDLIEAVCAGEADLAERIVREHIAHALSVIVKKLP
ncbi:GntR family transcriptional regulator [Streptomyces sp. AJS327]|uniref:GntR family transcriptional regulator n=1 Tax=Streptomyces sp. AJS327 TaxID=2545265 RepID=UPI0015DDA008|nr:GntR family transcriptional regulator [Streptomyces sp. AJS327]